MIEGVLIKDDIRCVFYGTRKSFPRDYFKKILAMLRKKTIFAHEMLLHNY